MFVVTSAEGLKAALSGHNVVIATSRFDCGSRRCIDAKVSVVRRALVFAASPREMNRSDAPAGRDQPHDIAREAHAMPMSKGRIFGRRRWYRLPLHLGRPFEGAARVRVASLRSISQDPRLGHASVRWRCPNGVHGEPSEACKTRYAFMRAGS